MRELKNSTANSEDASQLIRSSSSVGANYIEANDSLGKKDFARTMDISNKNTDKDVQALIANNEAWLKTKKRKPAGKAPV